MKLVAVFAADLHISDYIWSSHPSIAGDSFFALKQVVDIAITHACPLVLAGDVLELMRTGTPTSRTVSEVSSCIERLRAANIPLYYISGQHDLADPSWLESINPWAKDVSQREFSLGGKRWFGINYQETESLAICLQYMPEDLYGLVLHQRWREFHGGSNSHGSLTDIVEANSSLKIIVTGDLHKLDSGKERGCHFISPGATHKRTIAEPNVHYVVGITDTGSIRPCGLLSRPVINVVASSRDRWSTVIARLPQFLEDAATKAIKAGIPPGIATPLLIIEDQAGCEAVQEAKAIFSDRAHVLAKNSTLKTETVARDFQSLVSGSSRVYADKKEAMLAKIDQWATSEFGANNPTTSLIRGLVDGVSVVSLRDNYLKGVTCGDSSKDPLA